MLAGVREVKLLLVGESGGFHSGRPRRYDIKKRLQDARLHFWNARDTRRYLGTRSPKLKDGQRDSQYTQSDKKRPELPRHSRVRNGS
jgi:hypothetical protein